MHLIISKLLKDKNADRREKTISKNMSKWKRKLSTKLFLFVWAHNRSCKCSFFLLDFFMNLLPLNKWCKCFTRLVIPSAPIAVSFQLRSLCSSHKFFIWIYDILKNEPRSRVFHNVKPINLDNVLQRNLWTGRAKECIFKAFEAHILKICLVNTNHCEFVDLMYVLVCPKDSGYVTGEGITMSLLNQENFCTKLGQ